MVGIKPLLPSLREKKRYVAFEIISKGSIRSFNDIAKALWNSFMSFMGEFEMAKAGIIMLPHAYNTAAQRGVLRVNNRFVDHVKSSISLISAIDQQPVIVRTLGVSGIVNKVQKKYIGG